MLTMLVDYGVNLEARRQQLLTCLQDYMENVMLPRMNREGSGDYMPAVTSEGERRESAPVRSIGRERRYNNSRRGIEQAAASRESSKEKKEDKSGDDWLKDLNPDQKRMLGELLKEFIS